MEQWRKNLAVIWIAQFASVASFAGTMPFAPYYLQELGVTDPTRLKIWVSIYAAATPFMLVIWSPIWGAVGDRYGRRLMVLRSHLSGVFVLGLMGLARSPETLVALRLAQGILTGTVTAAQMMIAADSPTERSGFAIGALSASTFAGGVAGAVLGGTLAHTAGYRLPYFVGSALQVICLALILYGTRESFMRPAFPLEWNLPRLRVRLRHFRVAFPILVLISLVAVLRKFDNMFVPLLVQDILGSLDGASLWVGGLNATQGVAGLLAGFAVGYFADRMAPSRLARYTSFGGAVFLMGHAVIGSLWGLLFLRFGLLFCSGGLEPVVNIWLAKITPPERRGLAFGWAGSARACGWMVGPLLSGALAAALGLRTIFVAGAILFLLLVPTLSLVLPHVRESGDPGPGERRH